MKTIKVTLTQNSYQIRIGTGLLKQVGDELKSLGFKAQVVIITNPTVNSLWGDTLQNSLEEAGFSISVLEVPDGEEYKSLEQAGKLYEQLSDLQIERMTPILAFGGGVIGDLAGFVAATYMRGVPLIHIPTTLLAQVDSSTGGKVAVNHGSLKNTVGSFYQPSLVIADTGTLSTLQESEFINGLAELIKHGVILDKDLFQKIENGVERLKSKEGDFLEDVISRSIDIKAGIVMKDEKDIGLRNILNYGHTIGHALETVSEFKIKHGNGVSLGMVAAGRISHKMGLLPKSEMERIESVLLRAGLPVKVPGTDIVKILDVMKHDKKKVGGKIRFILLKTIGDVFINDVVDMALVELVLKELYEKTPDLRHDYRK